MLKDYDSVYEPPIVLPKGMCFFFVTVIIVIWYIALHIVCFIVKELLTITLPVRSFNKNLSVLFILLKCGMWKVFYTA